MVYVRMTDELNDVKGQLGHLFCLLSGFPVSSEYFPSTLLEPDLRNLRFSSLL
jgi:hypothetical protein